MSEFDGPGQLQRAAELRDQPFTSRPKNSPSRRGAPIAKIVNPSGIKGTVLSMADGTARCRFAGSLVIVELPARWE